MAHSDPNECSRLLADHWSAIFSAREVDNEMIGSLAAEVTPIPEDQHQYVSDSGSIYPWVIPEVVFAEILDQKYDSCPGPDGIPYSAWKASGDI
eukprot:6879491-Pyramimonas_sp.AAC.1